MDAHSSGSSYQAMQAMIGLGHGGLFGVGLGAGNQKTGFLPESHTDFIFSVLGEEIGFVGLFVLLFCYAILIWRGFTISKKCT